MRFVALPLAEAVADGQLPSGMVAYSLRERVSRLEGDAADAVTLRRPADFSEATVEPPAAGAEEEDVEDPLADLGPLPDFMANMTYADLADSVSGSLMQAARVLHAIGPSGRGEDLLPPRQP